MAVRMRVQRGLFRIWVALTTFWLVAVLPFVWGDLLPVKVDPTLWVWANARHLSDLKIVQDYGHWSTRNMVDALAAAAGDYNLEGARDAGLSDEEIGSYLLSNTEKKVPVNAVYENLSRIDILYALVILSVPPMVLLLSGGLVYWAIRGFQGS